MRRALANMQCSKKAQDRVMDGAVGAVAQQPPGVDAVPPNEVAKLHFGAHFQAPGQTAGTVDVYGLQIRRNPGDRQHGGGGGTRRFGTAAEARVPRRRGRRRHAGHPGRGAAGAHAHRARQFSGALQQPELPNGLYST